MISSDQPKHTVLYIDDEPDNLSVFKATFRHEYNVITVVSPKEAIQRLKQTAIHLVISDYKMPEKNGIDFFSEIAVEYPDINRIILTAYSESEIVMKSINDAKVFYFVTKPWKKDELRKLIQNALENYDLRKKNKELIENLLNSNKELQKANTEIKALQAQLEIENNYLKKEIESGHDLSSIIGESTTLKNILSKVNQVAKLNTTVLILGETGTGKELVARYVHKLSSRSSNTFVKLNCAALPSTLVESELFGYEKGAFTGANQNKPGMFEIANGGTIFLDEIGEVPIEVQAKLLRVLQDSEFFRVGGSKPIKVNVRVIAATNRNLEQEIEFGGFRSDLFYRLNIFPITVPPLRERREDIKPLVDHFVEKYQRRLGIKIKLIPDKVYKTLQRHSWPGNIRELEGVIERSIIMSQEGILDLTDWAGSGVIMPEQDAPVEAEPSDGNTALDEMEKQHILQVLKRVNWKVSGKNGAAEILKLNHNTLRSKMIKYGIKFK
jgi:formate hydrogenlyase transcriptional activator